MGLLKVEKLGGHIALVPDAEAEALLQAVEGDVLRIELQADGRIGLDLAPRSDDERFERGRAFLTRYRAAFDTLAK